MEPKNEKEKGLKWFKNIIDPAMTRICIYVIGTVSILYLLYHLSGTIFTLCNTFFAMIGNIFYLLRSVFWGFFLAYLLMPVTDFLQSKLANAKFNKKGKSMRSAAVALTILIVIATITIFFSVLISTFTSQVQIADIDSIIGFFNGIASNISAFYQQVSHTFTQLSISSVQLQEWANAVVTTLSNVAAGIGRGIMSGIENIPNFLSQFFFVFIFAIWFLIDGAGIAGYWSKVMYAVFNDHVREKISQFLEDADQVFSGYIRGQMLDAVIMMLMISVLLSICKVPFAVTIGVLAGIGNLIPYVGPFIAYVGVIVVCLVNGAFSKMILSLVLLWVIQSVDGNVINPKLLGSHVHIHPMYVIIVLIIGGSWGGLLGMLFAVPIGALLKLQFDRIIKVYTDKKIKREFPDTEKESE